MKRPIILYTIAAILGILSYDIKIDHYFFIAILLVSLFLYHLVDFNTILIFFIIFIVTYSHRFYIHSNIPNELDNQFVRIQGIVVDYNIIKNELIIDHTIINNKKRKGKILIQTDRNYDIGEKIKTKGYLKIPNKSMNPGQYDYQKNLLRKGIYASLNTDFIHSLGEVSSLKYLIRKHIKSYLYHIPSLTEENQKLIATIFTGEKSMDLELQDNLRYLGLSHIIAVSGLHIGMFFMVIMGLRGIIDKRLLMIIGLFLIFLYAYVIGFPPSIVRAWIMIGLFSIAEILAIPYQRKTILWSTLFLILLVNPMELYAVGLQFSFLATFVIIYFEKYWQQKRGIIKIFWISTIIFAFLLPLQLLYFREIYTGYLLGNIIIVPLFVFIIYLSFFGYLIVPLKGFIFSALEPLINFLMYVIKGASYFSANIRMKAPQGGIILLFYATIFIYLKRNDLRYLKVNDRKLMFYIVCLTTLIIRLNQLILNPIYIDIIYIGQAESIIIQGQKKNYMIDTGGNVFDTTKGKQLTDYLDYYGIYHIPICFISHFDADHCYNLKYLTDRVKNICSRRNGDIVLMDKFNIGNYTYIPVDDGDKFILDNMQFTVYHNEGAQNENEHSIVLHSKVHGTTILFTGDIESETEKYLLNKDIYSDILIVPHHGSSTSSSENFIKRTQAKDGIISCGINNRFGFPGRDVLTRFKEQNINIYRTDQQGCIRTLVHRGGYQIIPWTETKSFKHYREEMVFFIILVLIVNQYRRSNKDEFITIEN